ncbi:MAG: thioredoxin family protein, partial [Nitrospinota bacterium]
FIAGLSSAAGKKESLSGTFLMGATAGLIISPCVGPVVFTLLMSVADKIAEANALAISAGEELSYFKRMLIAGKGGVLMGGFGIGIGIPFLLAGFFSNKMPRSGTWMNYIKYIFSVIIFYVAWVYYEKGMHTAKIPDDSAYTIMAAVVLLLFAIKLGAFRTEESRYKKAASFLLLFLSLISGYHGLLKSGLTTASKTNGTAALKEFETHGNLRWYRDYSKAKEMAVRTKTPMFIDFYADWCANCVEFGKLTLKNQKLNSSLKKVLLVKIYDTDPVFTTFQNKKEHRELKTGLPYFTILAPNETMLWEGTQYDAVGTMASQIEGALSKTD